MSSKDCYIWNFDYSSISSITKLLEENGLSMTKKFGQNFLISQVMLEKIVSLCGSLAGANVWEIGPGFGALTTKLLQQNAHVTAFEIDHGFCKILKEQAYVNNPNFRLIEGDALKTWKALYEKEGTPNVICANLPYNVGSIFIASLIENRCLPNRMVYTLQSEVVQRMCSKSGDKQYSGFSVLTNIDYENKEAFKIKAGCFFPPPNVDSSVVVMGKRKKPTISQEEVSFFINFVRTIFSQRRKTIKNNLKGMGLNGDAMEAVFEKVGICASKRPEHLTMEELEALSITVHKALPHTENQAVNLPENTAGNQVVNTTLRNNQKEIF